MTSEFIIAVHALVYLHHKSGTISSDALAANICTNPARVRKVLAQLKKGELVETREGADGGYLFALPPEDVSLQRIGDVLQAEYVGTSWRSGGACRDCAISTGMADVVTDIFSELNQACRARLSSMTIATVSEKIFGTTAPDRKGN